MEVVELVFLALIVFLLIFMYKVINPKIDINTETGHYILWYNDPFDIYARKAIQLWKV